jgi:hypothetical protein
MLYPSLRAPMRAPITPVFASKRSAAGASRRKLRRGGIERDICDIDDWFKHESSAFPGYLDDATNLSGKSDLPERQRPASQLTRHHRIISALAPADVVNGVHTLGRPQFGPL